MSGLVHWGPPVYTGGMGYFVVPPEQQTGDWLLRIPEAAQRLALSRSKLYELIYRGEIRTVRIGRAVRIAESELDRFIRDRTDASL